MYSINMSGTGLRYWICKIPIAEFNKFETVHQKFKEPYENLFFDLSLLNKLGFQSHEDLFCIEHGRGFIITERNKIEIKKKSKKLRHFDSTELLYSPLMFDPYHVVNDESSIEKEVGFKYIALIEYETGGVFKFKTELLDFDINKLEFHLNYIPISKELNIDFVTNLAYDGALLDQKKESVLHTSNKVILL
jgi:hypothetical protein